VASAINAAFRNVPAPENPKVFNIGGGSSATVREMVEGVVAELGIQVELRFGAKAEGRFEPSHLVADASLARNELNWSPTQPLSHAVWELSRESFSDLNLAEPVRLIK
jgi:nucleoside-diphosphate-sugar epimerase